jgi:outer membrane cobalamin receptor
VITIDTHAIKENIMAKAELLKGNKAMAWGIMAIGGVILMAAASGDVAAVENNATVGATYYYGMTVFEWIMAALAVVFTLLGMYLKNFYVLIVGILAFVALILSYLVF